MSRYQRLAPCFFSLTMEYGKLELKPSHNFSCFFILDREYANDYIHEQAMQLLLAGPLIIELYGEASEKWFLELETLQSSMKTRAALSHAQSLEGFSSELYRIIRSRSIVPHDTFLIYDREDKYTAVLKEICQLRGRKPLIARQPVNAKMDLGHFE